ncbi:MAG: DNA-processing protein DprA [Acidimicrobiales bacterium]
MSALPQEAYVVGLLTLPQLWPSRLAALLGMQREQRRGASLFGADEAVIRRTPAEAWSLVRSGSVRTDRSVRRALGARSDPDMLGPAWAEAAAGIDLESLWARHREAGVVVDLLGSPGYPPVLRADSGAPYALFRSGSHPDLTGVSVAIVGTRRCTPLGRELAAEYGEVLSQAGARVVSGLALGIDAGAHEGALRAGAAPPVGVVAGGFDRPYPARHRTLWRDVQRAGALVSEWPLGTQSEGWRFPARNRIIAAIADAVVVVESRISGGSVITAEQALIRDRPVFAVPGSVRSPASEGTNRLLRDGAIPACAVDDVVAFLELKKFASPSRARPAPQGQPGEVLAAVGWEPTPMDVILRRCPLGRASVALELAHLELDGWVRNGPGGWQRVQGS